jgi:hypothetical protein
MGIRYQKSSQVLPVEISELFQCLDVAPHSFGVISFMVSEKSPKMTSCILHAILALPIELVSWRAHNFGTIRF